MLENVSSVLIVKGVIHSATVHVMMYVRVMTVHAKSVMVVRVATRCVTVVIHVTESATETVSQFMVVVLCVRVGVPHVILVFLLHVIDVTVRVRPQTVVAVTLPVTYVKRNRIVLQVALLIVRGVTLFICVLTEPVKPGHIALPGRENV